MHYFHNKIFFYFKIVFYYTRSALLVYFYLLEWFLWVSPESGILNHGFSSYVRYSGVFPDFPDFLTSSQDFRFFFVKKSLYFVFIKDQILSCFDALAGPGAIFKCLCPKHNRETLIIIFCQTDEKKIACE